MASLGYNFIPCYCHFLDFASEIIIIIIIKLCVLSLYVTAVSGHQIAVKHSKNKHT